MADIDTNLEQTEEERQPEQPEIIIDDKRYRAPQHEMTGQQLRQLPAPPIGEDYDLWREKRDGDDVLIGNDEVVKLHAGMRFFSTPRHINPGSASPRPED